MRPIWPHQQANALQVFAAIKSLKTAGCMTAVLTISYQMNCEGCTAANPDQSGI
jgi:hypothetical protein